MSTKNLSSLNGKESLSRLGDGLHHAYLITGDIEKNALILKKILEEVSGVDIKRCPDYYEQKSVVFSVLDSRLLVERQKTKAFGNGRRFFVITARSFTAEAQNGLLKVLEEPISGHHFFILVPDGEFLLPTLRSRLFHVSGEKMAYSQYNRWCEEFINSNLVSRMFMVEKFLRDADEDKGDGLSKHRTVDMLGQLEKIFFQKKETNLAPETGKFLAELLKIKKYLNDTASSPRLILEYVAFICPARP